MDSLLMITETMSGETNLCKCFKAHMLMELGQKEEAIKILDSLAKDDGCEIKSRGIAEFLSLISKAVTVLLNNPNVSIHLRL